jgi:hypothetical protein
MSEVKKRGRPFLPKGQRTNRSISLYDDEYRLIKRFVVLVQDRDLLDTMLRSDIESIRKLFELPE